MLGIAPDDEQLANWAEQYVAKPLEQYGLRPLSVLLPVLAE
jgi:hypothetical protein